VPVKRQQSACKVWKVPVKVFLPVLRCSFTQANEFIQRISDKTYYTPGHPGRLPPTQPRSCVRSVLKPSTTPLVVVSQYALAASVRA
jgi:hypothetical protein